MDDWDTVTKIGSKTRGGGGAARETVVRGKAALNAAQRSGAIVGTEKKYATGNAKPSGDGQRQTMLDRADDVVALPKPDPNVRDALMKARQSFTPIMTQNELAKQSGITVKIIQDLEKSGSKFVADQVTLTKLEKTLKWHLRGASIGTPKTLGPKKK